MSNRGTGPATSEPSGVRQPGIAHEIRPTVGLTQRQQATSERELALVDRIIALQNQLAEAHHRYELAVSQMRELSNAQPVERFSRARSFYGALLKVPVLGYVARRSVRAAKWARRGGR